ncbi:MAG: 3-oxoacyl-ACP synthase [Epulopiscium sp. Nele67-Bin004]|nr:MAG: 3-oxoacyl-ACP synthase [Epulopiscium sp. Nele67-Bin004]
MRGVKISGTGSAKPTKTLTNDDISKIVDTSDEWITTRTGIKSRYISSGETTVQLATDAAILALKNANLNALQLDLIIVATITPDQMMPTTAAMVQNNIGAKNATAFDISAACSGFVFGSKIAVDAIKSGSNKTVLVIGAELLSKVVDWSDRNTCVLFGDGAGAAVYEQTEHNKILDVATGTDGTLGQVLRLNNRNINNCLVNTEEVEKYMVMDGKEVYRFATNVVPKSISNIVETAGLTLSDINYFILHQANERMIDSIAKKLGIDGEKFIKNLATHGNTSAASIPIALDEAKHKFKTGDKIVLTGFGGGLTWGSILLEW